MPSVDLTRVPSFYHNYISKVGEVDLLQALETHLQKAKTQLEAIPEEKWDYKYAEGKWTIKEVVQHIIDTERIFCYRALCFARKDDTPLPGFDENLYAIASTANKRTKEDLLEELGVVQQSSALLFQSFDDEQLQAAGVANGKSIYVEAIGFILVGHVLHHLAVITERYL